MQPLKLALEATTSHGLPRIVTNKPLYVRLMWLLLYLFMLALFLKGFSEFIVKLRSQQVTTSLDANSVKFQFPDVYACFENPISASYAASIDQRSADAINEVLLAAARRVYSDAVDFGHSPELALAYVKVCSSLFPMSLPYKFLINSLAHRTEQSLIDSYTVYKGNDGMPTIEQVKATQFFEPTFLSCQRWQVNSSLLELITRSRSSSGLFVTLLTDTTSSELGAGNESRVEQLYAGTTPVPLSDWSLSVVDFSRADRRSGVRVFLTPPGEYPSDFVTSFSLGPGKHHTVEIGMTQQVYKDGQFDCVSDAPDVQFVNPYDQTPYNHAYSYSYCYYYEYHRQYQAIQNTSGYHGPMPWPLRGPNFETNLVNGTTGNLFDDNPALAAKVNVIDRRAQEICNSKRPCSTLDYTVSVSSADWPTQSSLAPFISSSVNQAWESAKARNLSVPALDFLMTGNASSVTSYVRSNLLKVHFKPSRVLCDQLTFSKDYGLQNFISDIGGIMGIYLGMSLLTMCELVELAYDLIASSKARKPKKASASMPGSQVSVLEPGK